jgi:hypothetical protein
MNNMGENFYLDRIRLEISQRTDYITQTQAQITELAPDLTIAESETDWDLKKARAEALTAIA